MRKKSSGQFNDYYSEASRTPVDDATLKRFVRLTGGVIADQKKADRASWVAWAQESLEKPERLKAAIAALRPGERMILSILRDLGGEADESILCIAAYGAGATFPGGKNAKQNFHEALNHLVKTGMALNCSDFSSPTRLTPIDYFISHSNIIFSDDRILALAGEVTPQATAQLLPSTRSLPSTHAPTQMRLPHLITMQLVGLLQAIEHAGGLGLTQAGAPRAIELRKIAKAINWPEGSLQDGPVTFPAALPAMVNALQNAGILQTAPSVPTVSAARLLPGPLARTFTDQPLHHVVRSLLVGMINASWTEEGETSGSSRENYPAIRAALFYLLSSIPYKDKERGPLYKVDDLDSALFDRIGSLFGSSSTVYRTSLFSFISENNNYKSEDTARTARRAWLKTERPWLNKALCSWLYFLGVVELALKDGQVEAFRLTDLGRAALHLGHNPPEIEARFTTASRPDDGPAWVIQPNFDIIAYLDRLNTSQLAFLERHADRRSAQEHLAEYRLTRDSVYRGLEGGTQLNDLLGELARGSGRDLPQNIEVEIREWAAQRERITLRRRATLAEFPSESARELAVRAGLVGKPIGERYALLTSGPNRPLTRIFKHTVNYDQAPQRNLLISEDGIVSYHHPSPDLLLQSRLKAWSEPHPSGGRVFTQNSVKAAVAAGRSISSLLNLIDDRQYKILPALMRASLRAWAGEKLSTTLEPITILRTSSSELIYAFQQSDLLRPFLVSTITPGIFLVHADKVEELRAVLKSLGLHE